MPLYSFQCPGCGQKVERFIRLADFDELAHSHAASIANP